MQSAYSTAPADWARIILSSSVYLLYTVPMNINGYVLFFINTLDTIVQAGDYFLYSSSEYCILLML